MPHGGWGEEYIVRGTSMNIVRFHFITLVPPAGYVPTELINEAWHYESAMKVGHFEWIPM